MNIRQNILKIALLFGGAIFFLFNTSFGQEYIELLDGSDEIKLDGKTGNYIITGNVIFKKDDARLYCDSAYFNVVKDHIKAYGKIHLNQRDTLNMFCDSLFFDTKKELAKLYGNVRVRNNEYKLTTDSLDYDLKRDVGIYRNHGMITSIASNDSLSSQIGYFYPKLERFNFRNNVVYKNDDYTVTTDTLQFNGRSKLAYFYGPTNIIGDSLTMYCEKGWYDINKDLGVLENNARIHRVSTVIKADSLYYSANDSLYIAQNRVSVLDTANNVGFAGDYAYSNEKTNLTFITGHALAKRFDDRDTLYIHADTIKSYNDSIGDPSLMLAHHGVKLFRGDMQGICDSLSYDRHLGEMNLYYEPILWAREAQLSGDTITVYEENDEIKRAFIRKDGLVVTNVDSTNYYNQVTGTYMQAHFDSTEIRRVDIEANARTIYFLEQEEENDTTIIVSRKGMNRIYASNITLRFGKGDIESATYRETPDGRLYPMDQINKEEERVQSFKWVIEKRPLSWQQMIMSEEELNIFYNALRMLYGYPFIELNPEDSELEEDLEMENVKE